MEREEGEIWEEKAEEGVGGVGLDEAEERAELAPAIDDDPARQYRRHRILYICTIHYH